MYKQQLHLPLPLTSMLCECLFFIFRCQSRLRVYKSTGFDTAPLEYIELLKRSIIRKQLLTKCIQIRSVVHTVMYVSSLTNFYTWVKEELLLWEKVTVKNLHAIIVLPQTRWTILWRAPNWILVDDLVLVFSSGFILKWWVILCFILKKKKTRTGNKFLLFYISN